MDIDDLKTETGKWIDALQDEDAHNAARLDKLEAWMRQYVKVEGSRQAAYEDLCNQHDALTQRVEQMERRFNNWVQTHPYNEDFDITEGEDNVPMNVCESCGLPEDGLRVRNVARRSNGKLLCADCAREEKL